MTDCLTAWLMPSVKHNSITAMATGLIFSLFNVASAREVPFGIPLYVQCILQGLTSVLLYVPFIFADSEKRWFGGCTWWLPLRNEKSSAFFIGATFNTEVLFKHFLIRIAVWQVEHSWQRRAMDTSISDDNRGARMALSYFSQWLLWLRTCFSNSSWFILLYNGGNIANKEW